MTVPKNEPGFTLLARDPQAPGLIMQWVIGRKRLDPHGDELKLTSATKLAFAMIAWKQANPDVGLKVVKPRDIVSEEWQRAVKEFSLQPGSPVEEVVRRVLLRFADEIK